MVMPGNWRMNNKVSGSWIKKDMYAAVPKPTLIENLYYQAQVFPLPGFLRYEDRNSMAWSIESRTPFMDYRLFEFVFGLPDEFIYSEGVTKKVMREAMKDVLPQKVLDRKDKMGFVSPEEVWLKGEGKEWFMDWLRYMSHRLPEFVDGQRLEKEVVDIIDSKKPFNFLPWRVSVLGNWLNKNC
jgi:asparagine synthase (glutamine-hydrolysing)